MNVDVVSDTVFIEVSKKEAAMLGSLIGHISPHEAARYIGVNNTEEFRYLEVTAFHSKLYATIYAAGIGNYLDIV